MLACKSIIDSSSYCGLWHGIYNDNQTPNTRTEQQAILYKFNITKAQTVSFISRFYFSGNKQI